MFEFSPPEIVYSRGAQPIRTVPQDWQQRPVVVSSPTYTIEKLERGTGNTDREIVASGTSATVDSTTATLDADAGPDTANAYRVQLSSGASNFTKGRRYLIQKSDGLRQLVLVVRVDTSADDLYLETPLRRSFASGDTIRGVEVSGTFPASEADDEENVKNGGGPYRVRWEWTIEGDVDTQDDIIWLRRNSRTRLVTTEDVIDRWPASATWARNRISPEQALKVAHEDYYSAILLARLDPHYYYTAEVGRLAIVHRAQYYLHLWRGTEESIAMADRFLDEYKHDIGSLTQGESPQRVARVDPDTDTAPAGRDRTYKHKFITT